MPITEKDDYERVQKVYEAKTQYRIWLIGDPVELGYEKEKAERANEHWIPALLLVYQMIHHSLPDDEVFAGASIEWINNVAYHVESHPVGRLSKPYTDLCNLIEKGYGDPSVLNELRQKHIVIEDFAIPKEGKERVLWDRMLKVYEATMKELKEKNERIFTHINEIAKEVKQ